MTDAAIADLDPRLQPLATQFLAACKAAGLVTRITVTWRSSADQNACKSHGLSRAGAGQSPHNCMLDGKPAAPAFDFVLYTGPGFTGYVKNGTDPLYARAGAIIKSLALEWGGDWTPEKEGCNPDYDHAQLSNWKTLD